MNGVVQAPTRSAVLDLQNEQVVVNEAYTFLDEKRLLLAAELLRQLDLYQRLNKTIDALQTQANETLQSAVMFHGLNGLQVYPVETSEELVHSQNTRNFMGVTLLEIELSAEDIKRSQAAASNPSARADDCRQQFCNIVKQSVALAALSGNLYRLLKEYRLTERRSRALENVILPEIEQNLREMSLHLEELDLEDAIRVFLQSGKQL